MFPKSKIIMLTAASASLAMAGTSVAIAGGTTNNNPYVAGDMHNHNTCQDGSVSVGYQLDRSLAKGTAVGGGQNFDIDWYTLGNHGGSGNRDCRFSDTSAGVPGETTTYWNNTLGQTIDGITITSLKGTPNGTGNNRTMWKWQVTQEVEWPYVVRRSQQYNKVVIEGLEWITPGHEHTDVAVITGQTPLNAAAPGSADNMAQFEYLFDRADTDAIGPLDSNGNQIWPGKISNSGLNGTTAHQKAVTATAWLQSRHPLASYVVPTHSERAGAFNPASSSGGFNIESFRDFNNAGPTVAFGIESAGHMAQVRSNDSGMGSSVNGGTGNVVGGGTYGLQGVYTAKIGGLWDGLLGEGRNFFIYVSSDWHQRGVFGARDAFTTSDFWPGEYTKLYVPNTANFTSQNVIDGMRSGNSYSVNADIIGPDMVFRAHGPDGVWKVMGETVVANAGETVTLEMSMTVPATNFSPYSFNNPLLVTVNKQQPLNKPSLDHVDLITGDITGVIAPGAPGYAVPNAAKLPGADIVYNPSAKIAKQIPASSMTKVDNADGSSRLTFTTTFTASETPFYIRSRGTNIPPATLNVTDNDGNPVLDNYTTNVPCLDAACPSHLQKINNQLVVSHDVLAWSNAWFYANPIFVRPASYPQLLVEKNAAMAKTLAARSTRR